MTEHSNSGVFETLTEKDQMMGTENNIKSDGVNSTSSNNTGVGTSAPYPSSRSNNHNNTELKPKITVLGVGGAGGNAVNNMIRSQLEGVEFVVMNTDAQAISQSLAETKIQLGAKSTQGLGAGSKPEIGKTAAEESLTTIENVIEGSNMIFIAAGMGGGTGTGAAPVVAKAAKDKGILTVGVVTKPFQFEGAHRMRSAEAGIEELQKHVDTLIVIPNQNLFRISNENTTFADAFKMADDVLYAGVRGITDLMIMPGLINLDFADVRSVMSEMGKAMMGTGEAEGEGRAIAAAEAAIANPLLDDVSMRGAKGVLISITGGMDMTLFEVDEAANRIRDEIESEANIIFGSTFDERLNGRLRVSVVATGIDAELARMLSERNSAKNSVSSSAFSTTQSSDAVSQSIRTATSTALERDAKPVVSQQTEKEELLKHSGINFDESDLQKNNTPDLFSLGEETTKTSKADLFSEGMDSVNNNQQPLGSQSTNSDLYDSDELADPFMSRKVKKKKPGFFSRLFGISDEDEEVIKSSTVNNSRPGLGKIHLEEADMVTKDTDSYHGSNAAIDKEEEDDLDIPAYMRRLK